MVDVVGMSKSSSVNKDRCQRTCLATCVAAIYSASAVESATEVCFFELQETAPPAIVTTYPLIDLRSEASEAQSASQKMLKSVLRMLSSPPKVSLLVRVYLR